MPKRCYQKVLIIQHLHTDSGHQHRLTTRRSHTSAPGRSPTPASRQKQVLPFETSVAELSEPSPSEHWWRSHLRKFCRLKHLWQNFERHSQAAAVAIAHLVLFCPSCSLILLFVYLVLILLLFAKKVTGCRLLYDKEQSAKTLAMQSFQKFCCLFCCL